MTEAAEAELLRSRIAELERQLEAARAGSPSTPRTPRRRSAWWALSSGVAIVLACILAPVAVASVWADTQISDTEQYVETVAPLANDPAVQSAIADEVTRLVVDNLEIEAFTTQALTTVSELQNVPPRVAEALPALAVPITNGIESFTRDQVRSLLATPEFANIWAEVNRVAHAQVLRLLQGEQGGALSAQDGTITLNIGPIIEEVKSRLVAAGFTLAERLPVIDRSFVLVQSESVTKAQGAYRLLNTLGGWLPLVVLALLAAGVLLAGDRRRTLLRGALGITCAMIVLGVGLALARSTYVQSTPANVLTPETAGDVFDTLVRFLRSSLRAVAVLGLVVALAAFLSGPTPAAIRARSVWGQGITSVRGGAEAAGWKSGRVGVWVSAHKRILQAAALIAAGMVLVFWQQPTGWVVIWMALIVLLVLALVEFLAGPPAASVGSAPPLPRQPA